jgi:hypothetical protein
VYSLLDCLSLDLPLLSLADDSDGLASVMGQPFPEFCVDRMPNNPGSAPQKDYYAAWSGASLAGSAFTQAILQYSSHQDSEFGGLLSEPYTKPPHSRPNLSVSVLQGSVMRDYSGEL